MSDDSSRSYSRRELLARTSQQGIALGAIAALANSAVAPEAIAADKPTAGTIPVTDYDRACVRFRIDTTKKPPKTVSKKLPMTLNNVRMTLDARTQITHKTSGASYEYVLSSSCKSEQVWVDRDVWHQPNADMCMVASRDEFLVYKRWDKTDKGVMLFPPSLGVQPERQIGNPVDMFDRFSIDLPTRPGRVLETTDAIIETLFAGTPVISQTEYESGDYRVLLEYPVKVVNFSEREKYYQVDTGPILMPDFEKPSRTPLENLRLAYVAHNVPEWAEFIVCVPTPLNDGLKVHHYSQSIRIEGTRNRMIAIV